MIENWSVRNGSGRIGCEGVEGGSGRIGCERVEGERARTWTGKCKGDIKKEIENGEENERVGDGSE